MNAIKVKLLMEGTLFVIILLSLFTVSISLINNLIHEPKEISLHGE